MTIEDYTSLITSQHSDKPKFLTLVESVISPILDTQNLPWSDEYDVDTATGVSLDYIGQWVGISRDLDIPISGVYFEWGGTDATGWGSGVWQGEFDPDTGIISLPDDSYRTVIKMKIASNRWNGTVESAYEIWRGVFQNSIIIIEDHQDMTMSISISGTALSAIDEALLRNGYLTLKPIGVRIRSYATIIEDGKIFGWGIENDAIAGWGTGQWALQI